MFDLSSTQHILSGMEDHKEDVGNLQKVADEVMELIGSGSPMANNIRSQVADIHDCWNKTVRLVIEAISKVRARFRLVGWRRGLAEHVGCQLLKIEFLAAGYASKVRRKI